MRNTHAIRRFLDAATVARDPLDATACRRAAVWLRWCDGFGATLVQNEAERIALGGALGDCARQIIRRLAEVFPAPPEAAGLMYLDDDEGSGWIQNISAAPGAATLVQRSDAEEATPKVKSPFGDIGLVFKAERPGNKARSF